MGTAGSVGQDLPPWAGPRGAELDGGSNLEASDCSHDICGCVARECRRGAPEARGKALLHIPLPLWVSAATISPKADLMSYGT